jgi:hypothetical protein
MFSPSAGAPRREDLLFKSFGECHPPSPYNSRGLSTSPGFSQGLLCCAPQCADTKNGAILPDPCSVSRKNREFPPSVKPEMPSPPICYKVMLGFCRSGAHWVTSTKAAAEMRSERWHNVPVQRRRYAFCLHRSLPDRSFSALSEAIEDVSANGDVPAAFSGKAGASPIRVCYERSKRSRFMTLFHAATKSCRNFSRESSHP